MTRYRQRLVPLVVAIALAFGLTSCFTGVEGTKKITLTKDDRKQIQPSPEEEFFKPIAGTPLSDWQPGRQFIAADNKTLLIFDQQGLPLDPEAASLGGKKLTFSGQSTRLTPDGSEECVLLFSDSLDQYRYNTGKSPANAAAEIMSDQIPMMIDVAMVDATRELLKGKQLWTRSPLWYDESGNRIPGRKYVPVTISDVHPGTIVFPVSISFVDADGNNAIVFMNYGNSGKESRSFANLFYLSDFRQRYPGITDEVWQLICDSNVKTGMTKTECKLALGNPSEVDTGHDYSQTLDLWHYPDGAVLWFEDGLLTRFRR